MRLNIKPLSVNEAWQGRRVKTKKYRDYEKSILMLLRPMKIPKGKLELYLKWGFSSAGSDWDNPIKPFQDCLQKKYAFNDNRVIRAITEKVKVKKGEEFIEFEIKGLTYRSADNLPKETKNTMVIDRRLDGGEYWHIDCKNETGSERMIEFRSIDTNNKALLWCVSCGSRGLYPYSVRGPLEVKRVYR